MASETFLASFGLTGLRLLASYGIDPDRFVRELGLDTTQPPDASTRLPSTLVDRGFELACASIPGPAFALRAGECWHPSHLGTLGYAWLSSDTLRTALRRLERFSHLLGQKTVLRCQQSTEGLCISLDLRRENSVASYAMADFNLSLLLSMCRANYGSALALSAVNLQRPAPADRRPWDNCFGCAVSFGQPSNSLTLTTEVVDSPLPTANRELAKTFDSILAAELAALRNDDLEGRCRVFLLQQLTSGEPAEEDLATALAMSRRTLQRKLGELDLTYRMLLEKTRHELALRYLDDPTKSVTDITFLLGFSEQSAFSRAFKRWTGKAPTDYREQATALH